MSTEPALTIGGAIAVINAAADLLAAFGFSLTARQLGALDAFLTIVLGLLAAVLIRGHVVPLEKLARSLGLALPVMIAPAGRVVGTAVATTPDGAPAAATATTTTTTVASEPPPGA